MVTFMGTKQRRDLLTNANLILEPVWPEDVTAGPLPAVVRALPCARRPFFAAPLCETPACLVSQRGEGRGEQGGANE